MNPNEKKKDISLICPEGEYIDGTFNPDEEIFIKGGIFKDCNDKYHPNHKKCLDNISLSPSPNEFYLSELITNQGNKIYNPNNKDKYSNFGELNGKCIKNNIPEGRIQECDPLDEIQACYVGSRDSLVPGESIGNEDIYNKYTNFNCNNFILETNTCKHNNNSVLSDVISFSSPIENNYLKTINNQKILKIVHSNIPQLKKEDSQEDKEMVFISEQEKRENKNLHLFIEKYFEKYEDMNPTKYFDKVRYTLKFNPIIDYITKETITTVDIYYKDKLEETLKYNTGKILQMKDKNILEILLKRNNHLEFIVKNNSEGTTESSYTTNNKLEGSEFGEPINCFISQNNNTFLKNIRYKEKIPSVILPYNPFVNIEMNVPTPSKDN